MVARARKTDCILNFDASQSGKWHRARKQLADRPNCARAGARSSNAHMAAVGPDVGIKISTNFFQQVAPKIAKVVITKLMFFKAAKKSPNF